MMELCFLISYNPKLAADIKIWVKIYQWKHAGTISELEGICNQENIIVLYSKLITMSIACSTFLRKPYKKLSSI